MNLPKRSSTPGSQRDSEIFDKMANNWEVLAKNAQRDGDNDFAKEATDVAMERRKDADSAIVNEMFPPTPGRRA